MHMFSTVPPICDQGGVPEEDKNALVCACTYLSVSVAKCYEFIRLLDFLQEIR